MQVIACSKESEGLQAGLLLQLSLLAAEQNGKLDLLQVRRCCKVRVFAECLV